MLGLLTDSDPRWIDAAIRDLDAVLVDHLHCELKAASHATSLVTRHSTVPRLVRELTALAQEELVHVAQVFAEIEKRGVVAGPPGSDVYVAALRRTIGGGSMAEQRADRLLVAALIEARSCERFAILRDHAPLTLRAWYTDLFESEARHHRLYASLAEDAIGFEAARNRLTHLAAREAEIIAAIPIAARIH